MKVFIGAVLVAVSLCGCAMEVADRDVSGQALARDTVAADCDRRARSVTDEESSGTLAPPVVVASQPWASANEWATATAGSKAQIERDIRWRHYQDYDGLVRCGWHGAPRPRDLNRSDGAGRSAQRSR